MAQRPIKTVHYKGKRVPFSEFLNTEITELNSQVTNFHSNFARLETALANLLHAVLDATTSSIPLAIYYSPTSFDARAELVGNALIQLATEKKKPLGRLLRDQRWPFISAKIDSVRKVRNAIAHGAAQLFEIRGKMYVRWIPPAHDVIRVGRVLAENQIPGLTHQAIQDSRNQFTHLIMSLEALNLFVRAAHREPDALPDRYRELAKCLRAWRSRFAVVPKPPKPPRQPKPSSASRRRAAFEGRG